MCENIFGFPYLFILLPETLHGLSVWVQFLSDDLSEEYED